MSLDNQPKSPLNMNYLLAETLQPEKKRVHPPEAAYPGPSPRARFGRLKRRNMKQCGTPSSAFCQTERVLTPGVGTGLPLLQYSITPSLNGKSDRRPIHPSRRFLAT